jgi:hypothetical protein
MRRKHNPHGLKNVDPLAYISSHVGPKCIERGAVTLLDVVMATCMIGALMRLGGEGAWDRLGLKTTAKLARFGCCCLSFVSLETANRRRVPRALSDLVDRCAREAW